MMSFDDGNPCTPARRAKAVAAFTTNLTLPLEPNTAPQASPPLWIGVQSVS